MLADAPLTRERREWKRLLSAEGGEVLDLELTLRLGAGRRNRITTVYFDRADGALAKRVADGRGAMSRLRLRHSESLEGPGEAPLLTLERKHQRSGWTRKVRIGVLPAEIDSLLVEPARFRPVGLDRFGTLRPCCVVAYLRHAWEAEGLRITLDRELGCIAPPPDLIERLASGRCPALAAVPGAPSILECKSAGQPPPWLPEADSIPFSKLAWAVARLGV